MASDEVIDGLQDLLASMEALPLTLQRRLIARSLREAAQPIAEQMKATAPDDPETAGSRIRDSISVAVRDQTATGARAEIGPTRFGFAAIFAELGTSHQASRPFMQPAYDQNEDRAYSILDEVLGEGIEAEFEKIK